MRWPRVDVHRASVDMRSREFERWQSHLMSSRKVLPDAGRAAAAQRPGQQRAGRRASRPWLHALSTRARTRCGQYIAHAGRGFQRADGHTCAPLNVASLGGDAAAQGWRIRVPPPLHLMPLKEIVHARGAAALTQILVTWQRVVMTILSLQIESSCQASATLPV